MIVKLHKPIDVGTMVAPQAIERTVKTKSSYNNETYGLLKKSRLLIRCVI